MGPHPPAPRQARSQRTLERILASAEELLGRGLFEELTMARLAAHAGVAVGTIYTRFADKAALLPALFDRNHRAATAVVDDLVGRLETLPTLRARAGEVVRVAVELHTERRGLLRALTMYTRAHPQAIGGGVFAERARQFRRVARALLGDRGEVRDRCAEGAALFALSTVNAVCREQILFADSTAVRDDASSLRRRLTELLYRYLARADLDP